MKVKRTNTLRTYKNWMEQIFKFPSIGDTVDESFNWYFLEVLPPACMQSNLLQVGEPTDHNSEGRPRFTTLQLVGSDWIYTGDHTRGTMCEIEI